MNTPLHNAFRVQIESLSLFEFQDFITKLLMFRYGAEDFISPRDIKDKGADGIITSKNTLVACYGPKKIDKKRYLNKIQGDYDAYKENWENDYSNWMFVTNNDIPEYGIKKIISLKKDTVQIGTKNILQFIEELSSFQKRSIGNYLNIDKSLFAKDYLREIIDDLIKDASFTKENVEYVQQIYFPDKVKLNYETADITGISDEYTVYISNGVFKEISSLLYGYDDEDFEKLKHRILYDFNSKSGDFKSRLRQLTEQYLYKYSDERDDEYLYYIRGVLIYLFEQCLIGLKTEQENDTTAS